MPQGFQRPVLQTLLSCIVPARSFLYVAPYFHHASSLRAENESCPAARIAFIRDRDIGSHAPSVAAKGG